MEACTLLWAHGRDSEPWGDKSTALAAAARARGFVFEAPDFRDLHHEPDARAARLAGIVRGLPGPAALVGSSMGGYVAAAAAMQVPVRGLFLLAPALYFPGYERQDFSGLTAPVTVVHGWRDDVIPPAHSVRFAEGLRARLLLLDGDHRLKANLPDLLKYFTMFLDEIG